MAEEIGKEFEQTDIESVKELQGSYATTTAQIGQIEVELHLLQRRLEQVQEMRESAFKEYDRLQELERELVVRLNEKYGDGVLDLESGRFISSGQ
jgi:hypothetical protein